MKDRVLAIIVCHNPDIDALAITLNALSDQVDCTAIVDNASGNAQNIKNSAGENVVFLPQIENRGLGTAHNIGIDYARQKGFNYCLLLDQDSVPQADMVKELLLASHAKQLLSPLSAVGVRYLHADTGSDSFFVRFGRLKFRRRYCRDRDADGCIEADFLISSGCLIGLDAIDVIGAMDESLFIDHVDTEWFLRAYAKGFKAYGVCDAVMQHGLGERTHRVKIRRERNVPQHKPFRYYYIFRNSILLYRRDYTDDWWRWNDFQRLCQIGIMFGLLKTPRWQNAKMMCKGIFDGLRGISGKAKLG